MYHGGGVEGKFAFADFYGFAVFNEDHAIVADVVEVVHHGDGFFVGNDFNVRVTFDDRLQGRGMVGFHMVDDDIIQGAAAEDFGNVIHKFANGIDSYAVEEAGFAAAVEEVGVVADAVGQGPHSFK
ncbi:hypothetical protein HMPREF1863_00126 [Aedoeadaptatus coxii]|uniref:Uncharacterized protein n=1 Tax=Aedoeadaptatus coxii TaxID=755172 RepID=A0A134AL71_9FIRM|nr:hypothetical protein HMPREF1863_00126 [Peptoniphilus coxii]